MRNDCVFIVFVGKKIVSAEKDLVSIGVYLRRVVRRDVTSQSEIKILSLITGAQIPTK